MSSKEKLTDNTTFRRVNGNVKVKTVFHTRGSHT